MFVDLKGATKPASYETRDKRIEEYFKIAYQMLFNKETGIFKDKANIIQYRQYLGDGFLCAFPESEHAFALRLALCLQILSKSYNGSVKNLEMSDGTKISLRIGIEIDFLKEVTDLLADSLLFNESAQCKPRAFWGDALIDAQRICSFAVNDHILVGHAFYDSIIESKKTLDSLGLERKDELKDFFREASNYDKHGKNRKLYKFLIEHLSRNDIKLILNNPRNFDEIISQNLSKDIELGSWKDLENNGIVVQLANEKPILKEYYKGLVSHKRLRPVPHPDDTYEFADKEADEIYRYMFEHCDYYRSTTTLLPSEYNKRSPENESYLESLLTFHNKLVVNELSSNRHDDAKQNLRIIVNKKEKLKRDYLTFKDEWNRFLGPHKDENENFIIELKWIDIATVNGIRKRGKFQEYDDIGAWFSNGKIEYCGEWNIEPQRSNEGKFLLRPAAKYSQQIGAFLEELEKHSEPVIELTKEADNDRKKYYDQDLFKFTPYIAGIWKKHVQPDKRKERFKPFLQKILEKQFGRDYMNRTLTILDSSSGIGCDAALLKEMCPFSQVYLEVPDALESEAEEYLKDRRTRSGEDRHSKIVMNTTPWDFFEDKYKEEKFDLISVVGNFISRGKNLDKIKAHVERFKNLLKPKGLLIIDHRNYDRISKIRYLCGNNPEECYKRFKEMHKEHNGLYFGSSVGLYMWPVNFIDQERQTTILEVQYGESYDTRNESRIMRMATFGNDDFYNIITSVFGSKPRRYADYLLPHTNGSMAKKEKDQIFNNASFIVYVVEQKA